MAGAVSSDTGKAPDVFQISGPLVFETVTSLINALPNDEKKLTVDLGQVTEADSSALSLFLEWRRQSESRNVDLNFINWPDNLKSLLDLYNLGPIISK